MNVRTVFIAMVSVMAMDLKPSVPVRQTGVKPMAVCEPAYVEAILWQRGRDRLLILNNHSGKPLGKIRVTVPGLAKAGKIRSQQGSKIAVARNGDDLQLEMPLRLYDFILMQD